MLQQAFVNLFFYFEEMCQTVTKFRRIKPLLKGKQTAYINTYLQG